MTNVKQTLNKIGKRGILYWERAFVYALTPIDKFINSDTGKNWNDDMNDMKLEIAQRELEVLKEKRKAVLNKAQRLIEKSKQLGAMQKSLEEDLEG